ARRSKELSGGGFSPVCDPGPAVPWPMPGLSKSASAGSIAGCSGRAALARVGFAGSFFGFFGGFGILANMGVRRPRGKLAAPELGPADFRAIAPRPRTTRGATPTMPGGDLKLWACRD